MTDTVHLLGLAVEHAAAAVRALRGAEDMRWQGIAARRYQMALTDSQWRAAGVLAQLEAERDAAAARQGVP